MIQQFLLKLFGSKNEREMKRIRPLVDRINQLEASIQLLTDDQLAAKTPYFKDLLSKGATLEEVMPEAFAVVRETSRRRIHLRHFDVQLLGGVFLHEGKIAEMRTGEGKTLVATLPLYLNALTGRGVHLVTVNDYLANRDAAWMGPIYTGLGLTVGVIKHGLSDAERKVAYGCDITYGTNNEFGFDYLRDNMKFRLEDFVQREHHYCIVDEVDSILIDEARTPLIISGPADDSTDLYYRIERVVNRLKAETDFTVDEKSRTAQLTDQGISHTESLLGVQNLYDPQNLELLHHVLASVKAHALFKKDVDYVIQEGKVVIVDEFTGRLTPGRRWSDGLHQAIEAKEGVAIENENQTLATITYQNYFRMYTKLAGMTGSADTEAVEFKKIYNLDVVVVPTHKPMIRKDHADVIYKNESAKLGAVVKAIRECFELGQPVLVGTTSVEMSERVSELLRKSGVPHNVLNAKNHAREAEIIAKAGQQKSVTISTNMAGRGTDIVLGEGVRELGGLHVLGTARHESRRIDNQLRGRSGRQGDPGSSRFYLSLDDDLLRIFGAGNLKNWSIYKNMSEEEALEHRLLSKAIERAQKKVEGHNFDIRKHLLEYDDVMNQQRNIVYKLRKQIIAGQNLRDLMTEYIEIVVEGVIHLLEAQKSEEVSESALESFREAWQHQFGFLPDESLYHPTLEVEKLMDEVVAKYLTKRASYGEAFEGFERFILLQSTDIHWKEHLLAMDHLKEGIGLRGYAQKDPLVEYKREAYQYFVEMLGRIKRDVVLKLFYVQIRSQNEVESLEQKRDQEAQRITAPPPPGGGSGSGAASKLQPVVKKDKAGRNDPCPCGSGKKYKHCHGKT
jgi:preprotein translocase subunit SecA